METKDIRTWTQEYKKRIALLAITLSVCTLAIALYSAGIIIRNLALMIIVFTTGIVIIVNIMMNGKK